MAANGKPADSGRVQDAVVRLAQLVAGKADVGEFVTPTQLAAAIDGLAPAGSGATGGGITVTDVGDALVLSVAPDSPFVVAENFSIPKLNHATRHGAGQPDALELDASQITSGLVPTARLGSGSPGAGRVLMNGAWVVLDTAAVSGLSSALAAKADAAAVSSALGAKADATAVTSALAGKVSIPSGVATPGYVVAVKQGGGYEHVPAPSGGSGGSSAVYYSASTGWPARPAWSAPVTWVDPTGTAPVPPALDGDLVYVAGSATPTSSSQLLPAAVRDLDSGWWNQTTSAQVSGGTITLSGATVVQWGCADIPVKPNTFYQMNAYPASGTGTYTMEAMVTASAGNQYPYVTGQSGVGTLTFTTGPTATVAKFFVKGEANQTVTLTQIRVYEG